MRCATHSVDLNSDIAFVVLEGHEPRQLYDVCMMTGPGSFHDPLMGKGESNADPPNTTDTGLGCAFAFPPRGRYRWEPFRPPVAIH